MSQDNLLISGPLGNSTYSNACEDEIRTLYAIRRSGAKFDRTPIRHLTRNTPHQTKPFLVDIKQGNFSQRKSRFRQASNKQGSTRSSSTDYRNLH
jgi:hypothetical protein